MAVAVLGLLTDRPRARGSPRPVARVVALQRACMVARLERSRGAPRGAGRAGRMTRARGRLRLPRDRAGGALAEVPSDERPYALAPEDSAPSARGPTLGAARGAGRNAPVGWRAATRSCSTTATRATTPAFGSARLGLRATFFVVPTLVDTPGFVRWDQLREMVAAGMEVGSHSLTHPFVDGLDAAALRREFGDSKAMIEDRLGTAVRSASLPRGWGAPHLETVLAELGYRVFCTSRVGWWHPGDRPLAMPRVRASADLPVERFVAIVDGAPRALWGIQAVEARRTPSRRASAGAAGTGPDAVPAPALHAGGPVTQRTLILGLDGVTFDVVDPLIAQVGCPSSPVRGARCPARLRSTCPPCRRRRGSRSSPAAARQARRLQLPEPDARRYSGFSERLVNSSYFRGGTLLDHLGR
jgi:hypothetical protein